MTYKLKHGYIKSQLLLLQYRVLKNKNPKGFLRIFVKS